MATEHLLHTGDRIQRRKLIVGIATGQVAGEVDDGKNATASKLTHYHPNNRF